MKKDTQVLVVDDNIDLCSMMETILKFEGIQAEKCVDIGELRQCLNIFNPKVLVIDMLLSGYNGSEICQSLKSSEDWACLKILMVSAHPDAHQICKAAGADEFIAKPFDMDDFTGRVKALLL